MSDQVLILAAGIGQRFSNSTHKSLYPFYFGEGTLSKLLRQLAGYVPCENICVVTGNQADKVSEVITSISGAISIVFNSHYANGSSVTSLRAGIRSLIPNKATKGVWVLFADSIYSEESIRTIFERTPPSLTLATCPRSPQLCDAIGVDVNIEGKVSDIGSHCSNSMHVMVPAIYWPAATFECVLSQEAETARHQWEILHRLVDDNVLALPLPTDSILDIDTKADLCALRHQILGGEVQKYFSSNICK